MESRATLVERDEQGNDVYSYTLHCINAPPDWSFVFDISNRIDRDNTRQENVFGAWNILDYPVICSVLWLLFSDMERQSVRDGRSYPVFHFLDILKCHLHLSIFYGVIIIVKRNYINLFHPYHPHNNSL